MAAPSGTGGLKRPSSNKDEPASKRARVESVTKVFAADSNQNRSGLNRKRPRNQNVAMRDLVTQSRNSMMALRSAGSKPPRGAPTRVTQPKPQLSHPRGRLGSTSNGASIMEIDQDTLGQQTIAHVSTAKILCDLISFAGQADRDPVLIPQNLSHGPVDLDQAQPLHFINQSASFTREHWAIDPKNAADSQEQGSPRFASTSVATIRAQRHSKSNASFDHPSSSTLRPGNIVVDAERLSQPGLTLNNHNRGIPSKVIHRGPGSFPLSLTPTIGKPATLEPLSQSNPVTLARVPRKNQQNGQIYKNAETSSMPTWLVHTLSSLSPRYLASSKPNSSFKPQSSTNDTSEGSPLLSLHASLDHATRNGPGKYSLTTAKTHPIVQHPEEEDANSMFAFVAPPVSPLTKSRTQLIDSLVYAISTPPGNNKPYFNNAIAKEPHDAQPQSVPSDGSKSSLFNTSIPPIVLHNQTNAVGHPHSLHSYFTASPPVSPCAMLSDPIASSGTASNDPIKGPTTLTNDSSPSDPFGITWASLQRSKPAKSLSMSTSKQRRFFFSNFQSSKFNAQSTVSSLRNKLAAVDTLVPSSPFARNSELTDYVWAPSFPDAKLPNHRYAPPPQKSQLRSNFLGAEDPLVTAAAIEETTAAADQTSSPVKFQSADAPIHVRFQTPTISPSLSRSARGHIKYSKDSSSFEHSSSGIYDESLASIDEMCFFYDEPVVENSVTVLGQGIMEESEPQGKTKSKYATLEEPAQHVVLQRIEGDHPSMRGIDFQNALSTAGISDEEDLYRLLEADAGEEVEVGDALSDIRGEEETGYTSEHLFQFDGLQNDESHDSIGSLGKW